MAKVYPRTLSSFSSFSSTSSSSSSYVNSESESFTIWMKSLVFNSHGCTVYNSNGDIVYRVDNYDSKCSPQVFLMDIHGNVLFSLQKKKLRVFGYWDGYKWDACGSKKQQWFRVTKKQGRMVVNVGCDHETYKVVRVSGKLGFKIVDVDQEDFVVAEVKQKQTTTGINFGNDVFTLTVAPDVDQSLIMAIVMVHGLIHRQL